MHLALAIYGFGVLVGLVFTDARPLARFALALLWPIGPLAFVAVLAILVPTAMAVFPAVGAAALAAALLGWWLS